MVRRDPAAARYKQPPTDCRRGPSSCDVEPVQVICPTGQGLCAAVRFNPSCRISAIITPAQNSFGPRQSSLASQVSSVAATIMSTIPAMLTAACMAKLLENWVTTTKPMNDSKTPKQYIASEFSPQRISAVIRGFGSPCQSRGSDVRPRRPVQEYAPDAPAQGGSCRSDRSASTRPRG
jgi:hypothetical protein